MTTTGLRSMVGRVARTPSLRRLEGSFAMFAFCEHATWLTILYFALLEGGPREVGIVAVLQLLPGVLLAPFASYVGDRFAPQRALAFGYGAQCIAFAATAVLMASDQRIPAYLAASAAATCITFTRPAMASLLPAVTHTPSDLVAANVITGQIEQIGVFGGPVLAGAAMALWSPWVVFGGATVAMAIAFVVTIGVRDIEHSRVVDHVHARDLARQVFAGFATLRRERRLRVLVLLGAGAGFVKGVGDVIFVTYADVRLSGSGGISGLLAGAYGVGAFVGATLVAALARAGRVSRQFLAGALMASVPLLALSGIDLLVPAMVGFAVMGAGETVLQLVSGVTVQRESPTSVTSRVFGILEGLTMGSIAVGSLAVTLLTEWYGLGTAFIILAAVVAAIVIAGVLRLRSAGGDVAPVDSDVVDRLLADPVFAPLMAPTVERLARSAETIDVPAGECLVREGETGDRYYLVLDGHAEVTIDGAHVRDLGPGDSFGEVALLRGIPRTATVTAREPVHALAVASDDFIEAVTRHPRSQRTADATVDRWLG